MAEKVVQIANDGPPGPSNHLLYLLYDSGRIRYWNGRTLTEVVIPAPEDVEKAKKPAAAKVPA